MSDRKQNMAHTLAAYQATVGVKRMLDLDPDAQNRAGSAAATACSMLDIIVATGLSPEQALDAVIYAWDRTEHTVMSEDADATRH